MSTTDQTLILLYKSYFWSFEGRRRLVWKFRENIPHDFYFQISILLLAKWKASFMEEKSSCEIIPLHIINRRFFPTTNVSALALKKIKLLVCQNERKSILLKLFHMEPSNAGITLLWRPISTNQRNQSRCYLEKARVTCMRRIHPGTKQR